MAAAQQTAPASQPLFAAAVEYHRSGQLTEAANAYRHILAADPRHALSLYHLSLIELQRGQPRAAVNALAAAVAIDGGMPEWHYHLALAHQSCGQADDALRHYGHAVALKPDYAEAQANLGIALCCLQGAPMTRGFLLNVRKHLSSTILGLVHGGFLAKDGQEKRPVA